MKHITLHHPDADLPQQTAIELPSAKCRRQPKDKSVKDKNERGKTDKHDKAEEIQKKYIIKKIQMCFV